IATNSWVVFDRNAKLLLTLINSKWPLVTKRPSFCGLKSFLNISINNKPFFFSEVVTFEKFLCSQESSKPEFQAKGKSI
ncbi:MAG: hypothetical protein OES29_14825, partial [Desulfuromonadales bacterium]|nr:hypothetical protein [Desulfuromonadales bacterium]